MHPTGPNASFDEPAPSRKEGESVHDYVPRICGPVRCPLGWLVAGWFGACSIDDHELADLIAAWTQVGNTGIGLAEVVSQWPEVLAHPQACRVIVMEELAALRSADLNDRAASLTQAFPMIAAHVEAVRELCLAMASGDAAPGAGDELGKYLLQRRIGVGSFGEVWQAFDRELGRLVALKLLREGDERASDDSVRRVMAEARAAAAVDHPNVVRIHAAGRFDDGRPYIDTQLVGDPAPTQNDPHGVAVGVALDKRMLLSSPTPPEESAALIEEIARGVAAAHARGVVHRDIKPANIIVTGSGRGLLADFGLSALVERGDPERPRRSRHRITGTPAFMSPEQARGESATPASDVYSLGATLRFLLVGGLPTDISGELPGDGSQTIERLRRGELSLLRADRRAALLPTTLISIVDRAMHADAGSRYTSATQLADDLRAWAEHRPTLAANPGTSIRAMLWCRRHAAPVVVAALAMLVVTVMAWRSYVEVVTQRDRAVVAEREAVDQRDRAMAAEGDAVVQRDAAIAARDTSDAINTFMLGTLIEAHADEGGRSITLLEAVNQSEKGIAPLLNSQPLIEAGVRHVIGRSLATLGEFNRAREHLERALELRSPLLPEGDRRLLEVKFALAELEHFSENNQAAAARCETLLPLARRSLASDAPLLLSIIELDCAIRMATRLEPSIKTTLEELLRMHRAAKKVDQQRIARALSMLGAFSKATGDREQAISYFKQWRELQESLTGADSYASMSAASDLGSVYAEMGNVQEAEPLQRAASDWFATRLGDQHVHTLNARYNLAWMLLTKKKAIAESLAISAPLVAHARAAVGERNPLTLRVRLLEARGLAASDRREEAIPMLLKIADDAAALGPAANSTEAVACRTYVEACTALGRTQEAEAMKERAAAALKRARGQ